MSIRPFVLSAIALASVACGHRAAVAPPPPTPPSAASVIDAPSADSARARTACTSVGERGDPLVVDLRPEDRASLELAMREGLAVVAYDCHGLRVLDACTLRGSYGFTSFAPKEQVLRLESEDELRANLPFSGAALGAQIGGDMANGVTLDVALVLLGRARTTRTSAQVVDLRGAAACRDATHFVRGAFVGAFAMESGSRARARTAVEILHAGASAEGASRRSVRQRDGSLEQCRSGAKSKTTPRGCALLRLQLSEIDRGDHDDEDTVRQTPAAAAAPTPKGSVDLPSPEDIDCPAGFVAVAGKCAPANGVPAGACSPRGDEGCARACDAGDADACVRAAGELGAQSDPATRLRARALYARACAAGSPEGCRGELALARVGVGPGGPAEAVRLLRLACDAGGADSCYALGVTLEQTSGGRAPDPAGAARAYERGCDAGDAASCGYWGDALLAGKGVTPDRARALEALDRACVGDFRLACDTLAAARAKGK